MIDTTVRRRMCCSTAVAVTVAALGVFGAALAQQPQAQQAPAQQAAPTAQQTVQARPGAQGGQLGLTFGGGRSDNVFQNAQNGLASSYSAIGLVGDFDKQTRRFAVAISSDLEQRNYTAEGLESEPYGYFDGAFEFFAVPERFSWALNESHRQGRIDPFLSNNPLNRQKINIVTNGPRVTIPVGARTFLRLNGTRDDRSYENTNVLDSTRDVIDLTVARAVNTTTEVGLVFSNSEIDYDSALFSNQVDAVYFSYERVLASGDALLQAGANEVDLGVSQDTSPYLNLVWNRDVGARSRVGVSAAMQFVDTGQGYQNMNLPPGNIVLTADMYEERRIGVSYRLLGTRSQFVVGVSAFTADYQSDDSFNNDQEQMNIDYEYALTPQLNAGLGLFASKRTFLQRAISDKEDGMGLWLRKAFGRRLSLQFRYDAFSRDGQGISPYDERTARLMFRYLVNAR